MKIYSCEFLADEYIVFFTRVISLIVCTVLVVKILSMDLQGPPAERTARNPRRRAGSKVKLSKMMINPDLPATYRAVSHADVAYYRIGHLR